LVTCEGSRRSVGGGRRRWSRTIHRGRSRLELRCFSVNVRGFSESRIDFGNATSDTKVGGRDDSERMKVELGLVIPGGKTRAILGGVIVPKFDETPPGKRLGQQLASGGCELHDGCLVVEELEDSPDADGKWGIQDLGVGVFESKRSPSRTNDSAVVHDREVRDLWVGGHGSRGGTEGRGVGVEIEGSIGHTG